MSYDSTNTSDDLYISKSQRPRILNRIKIYQIKFICKTTCQKKKRIGINICKYCNSRNSVIFKGMFEEYSVLLSEIREQPHRRQAGLEDKTNAMLRPMADILEQLNFSTQLKTLYALIWHAKYPMYICKSCAIYRPKWCRIREIAIDSCVTHINNGEIAL